MAKSKNKDKDLNYLELFHDEKVKTKSIDFKEYLENQEDINNLEQEEQIQTQLVTLNKNEAKKINKDNKYKRKKDGNEKRINDDNYIIQLEDVSKYYVAKNKTTKVLSKINLKIKKGEFVILFGKSGSGKSTLLNLISGLDRASEGQIIVANKNLPYLSNNQLLKFRRDNVSFIFQSYNLLNNLTGIDNVETGLYLQKDKDKKIDIKPLFKEFDLEDVIKKYPSEMSGGQQQRISILRALAKNSDIIFADEPTGALDTKTSKIVLDVLRKINIENNKTIIMVSHDPSVVNYATRVITLSNSKIIEDRQII
ncbi:MAG: ATP-binding cassette domain-containing protein [Metamycoplasmataceae bacterium]